MPSSRAMRRMVILGAGTMSADIAARFLACGVDIHLVGRPGNSLASLKERVARSLEQLPARGAGGALTVGSDLRTLPWGEIDLVVESISENLDAKRRLFAELVEVAPPELPLASNSSSFPMRAIAEGLETQERMLNLHFFMPAHLIPLVEVVSSSSTDRQLAQRIYDSMAELGCQPVLVNQDIPGFLANRIQHALMREAWSLIDRGIASADDVDKVVRFGFGMRYLAAGPVLQKEHSGLDINCAASAAIYPDLCNDSAPPAVLVEKVRRGETGMKSGKGFWIWDKERIVAEKTRYSRVLGEALRILREDTSRDG